MQSTTSADALKGSFSIEEFIENNHNITDPYKWYPDGNQLMKDLVEGNISLHNPKIQKRLLNWMTDERYNVFRDVETGDEIYALGRKRGNKPGVELLLQKWNGDERMHLCVRTKGLGTYRIVLTMPIEQTVMNGDEGTASKVRFYGADGMFADVVIMNPEDINKGYIGILKDFSKKKKTEEEPSE